MYDGCNDGHERSIVGRGGFSGYVPSISHLQAYSEFVLPFASTKLPYQHLASISSLHRRYLSLYEVHSSTNSVSKSTPAPPTGRYTAARDTQACRCPRQVDIILEDRPRRFRDQNRRDTHPVSPVSNPQRYPKLTLIIPPHTSPVQTPCLPPPLSPSTLPSPLYSTTSLAATSSAAPSPGRRHLRPHQPPQHRRHHHQPQQRHPNMHRKPLIRLPTRRYCTNENPLPVPPPPSNRRHRRHQPHTSSPPPPRPSDSRSTSFPNLPSRAGRRTNPVNPRPRGLRP